MAMHYLRIRLATVLAVLCLGLMSASPIAAQQGNGNGPPANPGENGRENGRADFGLDKAFGPSVAETPELGSLALFGSGVAGAAGYALMRVRAGRRQRDHQEPT